MTDSVRVKLPPSRAGEFANSFPSVWAAYTELGKACAEAGPLDSKTRRLIKLAMAMGAHSEGAVHSHTRQALEQEISEDELRQVAILAITTLGFPAAIAGISWIEDILKASHASD